MKILVIGLGGIGQRHTRNLRALLGESVEIIAYRVRRLTHVLTATMGADQERDVEEIYNIRSFHSLDEALAEKPDIAYVCNPSSLHVAVTRACLIAGCDVFLEKPVADSLDTTAELVDLARTPSAHRDGRLPAPLSSMRHPADGDRSLRHSWQPARRPRYHRRVPSQLAPI